MKIIGLCGGSGSGKGSVSRLFAGYSILSIDTDSVYRKMTEGDSECMRALKVAFGEKIAQEDGSLDRKALRELVFSVDDAEKNREILNNITHKFILDETRRIIEGERMRGAVAVIVDAPLLFESGFDRECDVIVSVISDEDIRVSRIVLRDGISEDDARKRIKGQLSDEELIKRSDYVVYNNADLVSLQVQVVDLYKKIINI